MNIGFNIAHPSHYYLFKHIIFRLLKQKHNVTIFIKTKDILEELLIEDNVNYINIFSQKKGRGKLNLFLAVIYKNFVLYRFLKIKKINLLVSAASDVSQASYIAQIPSIIFNDDDIHVVPNSATFGWPFASVLLVPQICYMGKWERKTIHYNSYQKTAYLHPAIFTPNISVLDEYGLMNKRYFLIRSVSLTAHHDKNIRGLSNDLVKTIIEKLTPHGKIIISSERKLPEALQSFQKKIKYTHIHHLIYYADLLVADSQSMCHEAALMGTPSIRFNDFVGKIGVLNELEKKHNLAIGIKPGSPEELMEKIEEIISNVEYKNMLRKKAKQINSNSINLTAFAVWFIENYPSSFQILQNNPEYQENFR